MAANLPYSVGTAIVRRLLPRRDLFAVLVVMVQLEVAERMVAPPGGRNRGLLTLETEAYGLAEMLFTRPAGTLRPAAEGELGGGPDRAPAGPGAGVGGRARPGARVARVRPAAEEDRQPAGRGRRDRPSSRLRGAAAGVDPGARPQELTWDAWLALGRAIPEAGGAARHGEGRA